MPVCIVHTESNSTMLRAIRSIVKSSGCAGNCWREWQLLGTMVITQRRARVMCCKAEPVSPGLLRGSVCGVCTRPIASAIEVTTDRHGTLVEVINIGDTLAVSYYCWINYYVPINIHTINNCYAALFLSIIVIINCATSFINLPLYWRITFKEFVFLP